MYCILPSLKVQLIASDPSPARQPESFMALLDKMMWTNQIALLGK